MAPLQSPKSEPVPHESGSTSGAVTVWPKPLYLLALARARPKLLVVDEISWRLMPLPVGQVLERLQELHADRLAIL